MQSLLEFSANKSCPELSPDCSLLSDLLLDNTELYNSLQRSHSYPLFSESELDSSIHDLHEVKVTAVQDDIIEILSCRVIQEEDVPSRSALLPLKVANGETLMNDDSASRHRKRVVRAVGVVTFLLVLFSIILIGISLNMSKEIDEMVKAHNTPGLHLDTTPGQYLSEMTTSSVPRSPTPN